MYRLNKNQLLLLDGQRYRVDERRGDKVILKAEEHDGLQILGDHDITRMFHEGILAFPHRDPDGAAMLLFRGQTEEAGSLRKLAYVKAFLAVAWGTRGLRFRTVIADVAKQIGDSAPPEVRTVQRWRKAYVGTGMDPRVFLPTPRQVKDRLHPIVNEVMNRLIGQEYLHSQCHSMVTVLGFIERELQVIRARQPHLTSLLATPSLSCLRARIKKIHPYIVMAARKGEAAARQHFKQKPKGIRSTRPLELVLIDTWEGHLVYLDDDGNPIGRLYFTVAIDDFTRMVVGFCLSEQPPSFVNVAQALRNALAPKLYVAKMYPDIKNPWPCCGTPEKVYADTGAEHHNQHLAAVGATLAMDIEFSPAGQAWRRGVCERFFGTLTTGLFDGLPGATKSEPLTKGEYDAVAQATYTYDEIFRKLHRFIIDAYHVDYHEAIGMTPLRAWEEGIRRCGGVPPAPSDAELAILVQKSAQRSLQHYGIDIFNMVYRSSELALLRTAPGEKNVVTVRWDPTDISRIWVEDPNRRRLIEALADDYESLRGMTERQFKALNRRLRAKGIEFSVAKLLAERADIIAEGQLKKRRTLRERRDIRDLVDKARHAPFGDWAEQVNADDDILSFGGGASGQPVVVDLEQAPTPTLPAQDGDQPPKAPDDFDPYANLD